MFLADMRQGKVKGEKEDNDKGGDQQRGKQGNYFVAFHLDLGRPPFRPLAREAAARAGDFILASREK